MNGDPKTEQSDQTQQASRAAAISEFRFREFDPNQPLFFSHIPKTAGTSVRNIFKQWYGENLILHYFDETTGQQPKVDMARLEGASEKNKVCVFGHFINNKSTGFKDCYPEASQFITVVRDPLELILSTFYYIKREGEKWLNKPKVYYQTLEEFLVSANTNINHFLKTQVDIDNFQQVFADEFVYVGVQETLDQDIANMAKVLGFDPPSELKKLNAVPRDSVEIPDRLRQKFRERHQLEYAIYDWLLEMRR